MNADTNLDLCDSGSGGASDSGKLTDVQVTDRERERTPQRRGEIPSPSLRETDVQVNVSSQWSGLLGNRLRHFCFGFRFMPCGVSFWLVSREATLITRTAGSPTEVVFTCSRSE